MDGRPFGGLAVLVKKSVSNKVNVVGVNDKCRCLAVVITLHGGYKILVIDVYFPCYEPGQEYQSVMLDCIGFIENCIVLNDHDAVLILGDFNSECDKIIMLVIKCLIICAVNINVLRYTITIYVLS